MYRRERERVRTYRSVWHKSFETATFTLPLPPLPSPPSTLVSPARFSRSAHPPLYPAHRHQTTPLTRMADWLAGERAHKHFAKWRTRERGQRSCVVLMVVMMNRCFYASFLFPFRFVIAPQNGSYTFTHENTNIYHSSFESLGKLQSP